MEGVKYLSFGTKRRFGVEVEVTADTSKEKIKKYIAEVDQTHPIEVAQNNAKDYGNSHWSVKHDGSCKDQNHNHGHEVSSFVGGGTADIALIGQVVNHLRTKGIIVNNNCSVHVHAEVADFNRREIAKLTALWMKIEPILFQAVPGRRRRSIYCVALRKEFVHLLDMKFDSEKDGFWHLFWEDISPQNYDDDDRRVAFNLCNVCQALEGYGQNQRRTVEIRLPEGSIDPDDVTNWIRLFVRFVSLGKTKFFPKDLKAYNVLETLQALGLHAKGDQTYILSKALFNLKGWFLKRLIRHSSNKKVETEAFEMLHHMLTPSTDVRLEDYKKAEKLEDKPAAKSRYGILVPGIFGKAEMIARPLKKPNYVNPWAY